MAKPIIEITNLNKTYTTANGPYTALKDVSLTIDEGSIFGIIGLSGAGKSTLVRCLNGLESTTGGQLTVLGKNVPDLKPTELRELRKSIGMVFQQYNLMPSRTVENNVALPLRKSNLNREQKKARVTELLQLVGLESQAKKYPSQLSGGQQQRVAIARALANHPQILLLDEATSALDPDTTKTILELVERLNRQLHLTIIVVTHQMDVVKQICTDVAVIDKGTIVEQGDAFAVFSDPKADLTRRFVSNSTGLSRIYELIAKRSPILKTAAGERLIHMQYVDKTVSEGLVSIISTKFDLTVNILFASLDIVDGYPLGSIVAKYKGSDEQIDQALEFLKGKGIRTTLIEPGDVAAAESDADETTDVRAAAANHTAHEKEDAR
ncbi:methionine ABC transporter ATP-binding protein [Bifidobacterium aerophilum]|uniref:methionine ABC transporter ATP-binding protein n=1 Tax=Bifidobacterium aerophilum TaxID=1798155 RepID=UPI001953EED4|nr:ATP-binding cassette domain-containing protein [Bifidobacterium aerophilum]